jgi:hypothetical protein
VLLPEAVLVEDDGGGVAFLVEHANVRQIEPQIGQLYGGVGTAGHGVATMLRRKFDGNALGGWPTGDEEYACHQGALPA